MQGNSLPPQKSTFDGPPNLENIETIKEKRKKVIDAVIHQLQKQVSQLECTLHPTTHVPFRLYCKTLDTSYVHHRHSSPSLLPSIRSVFLAPVLSIPTALPSDDDNDPLPESGPHSLQPTVLTYSTSSKLALVHRPTASMEVLRPSV